MFHMFCARIRTVTREPAVFPPLQCAHRGEVAAPEPIMEPLDKLSDSVPVTTPPPELAHFLTLEKHRQD